MKYALFVIWEWIVYSWGHMLGGTAAAVAVALVYVAIVTCASAAYQVGRGNGQE